MDERTSLAPSIDDRRDRVVMPVVMDTPDARDAASPRCACGRALPTGRRRLSCSPACKLRRDSILRAVDRRRAWIALWRTNDGHYSQAEVDAEIAKLNADIAELLASLDQAPAHRGGNAV